MYGIPMPRLCIADDPGSRLLLKAWIRQPWKVALWAALKDRAEEIGRIQVAIGLEALKADVEQLRNDLRKVTRRQASRWLRTVWRPLMRSVFGDPDSYLL